MLTNIIWFTALQACAVVAASYFGRRLYPAGPRWARLLGAAQAYLLVVFVSTGGLAVAGQLTRPALLTVVGGIAAAAWLAGRHAPGEQFGVQDLSAWVRGRPLEAATIAALAAYWCVRAMLLGIDLDIDDLAYHAMNTASWAKSGSLAPTAFSVQAFFPSNCEILSLWFLTTLGTDAYASLTGLLIAWLLCLTLYGLTRTAVENPIAPFLSCALAFSSWQVALASFKFSAVDLGGPVFLLMGLLAIVGPPPGGRPPALLGRSLLLGCLLGLAVGSKVSLVLGAVVLVMLHLVAAGTTVSWVAAVASLVPVAAAAAITGGYWYVRNLIVTGNPLYPAETGPFSGPWAREFLQATSIVGHLRAWASPRFVLDMLRHLLDWPLPFALVAVGGYTAGAGLVVRSRGGLSRPTFLTVMGLIALGGVMLAAFPTMPFSGGNEASLAEGYFMRSGVRYIVLAYLCGVQLAAIAILSRPGRAAWQKPLCDCLFTMSILLFALHPASDQSDRLEVHALRLAIAGGWVGAWSIGLLGRFGHRIRPAPLGWVALIGVAFLGTYAPVKQWLVDRKFYNDPVLGDLCKHLQTLPTGTTIGYAGRDVPQVPYPLFGRRHQLRPIAIGRDGLRRPTFDSAEDGARTVRRAPPSCEDWRAALRASGVELFVTLRADPDTAWPDAHVCLAESGWTPVFSCLTATVWCVVDAVP